MIVDLDYTSTAVNPQVIDYWKQERLVLTVPVGQGNGTYPVHLLAKIGSEPYEEIASYYKVYSQASGDWELDIDVTDFVRATIGLGVAFNVDDEDEQEVYYVSVNLKGLINPENVIIPPTALPFFPMLAPFRYIGGFTTIFEVFSVGGTVQTSPRWRSYANGAWSAYEGLSRGLAQRTIGPNVERLQFSKPSNISETILIQEQDCGKEYALVRWVSFTGNRRQHVFELVKPKTSVADMYSLEAIDNEYVGIKGRVDGFVLQLDNLNPYDVWYYSDLLTSSKVEGSLDGSNFDRVQITDKDVTLPTVDGTPSGKVEFNVNWRRYDAVAM